MIHPQPLAHRTDPAADRIRRANAIDDMRRAWREDNQRVRNDDRGCDAAPVVLPAEAVEALADAFGVAAVAIHDGILAAALPTIDGRTVKVCTAQVRACRHAVRNGSGACVLCGQRDGAVA